MANISTYFKLLKSKIHNDYLDKKMKRKKIKLYLITEKNTKENIQDIINISDVEERVNQFHNLIGDKPCLACIVYSKKHVAEYIYRCIFLEKLSHYRSWCQFNHKQIGTHLSSSFIEYCKTTELKKKFDEYEVKEIHVSLKSLIDNYRISSGYNPIGCSYEGTQEIIFQNLVEKLNKLKSEE